MKDEDFDVAFADDVDISTFVYDHLPVLIKKYAELESFLSMDPILSLFLTDTNQRFSVQLFRDRSCFIEGREMIDFPLLTCKIVSVDWPKSRALFREVLPELIKKLDILKSSKFLFSKEMANSFEKIDGEIHFKIVDIGEKRDESISGTLVLNHYDSQPGCDVVSVTLSLDSIREFLVDPTRVASLLTSSHVSGQLRLLGKLNRLLQRR